MQDSNDRNNRGERYRRQNWDYRWAGLYFITICTYRRNHFFGKIRNSNMQLSKVGVIADLLWYEIKNHSKNVELGEFVVMPNHIHGILNIKNFVKTEYSNTSSSSQDSKMIGKNRYQNIGKNSISSIISGYKSAVTKHANRLQLEFGWQSRFDDHIIRNEHSHKRIAKYIRTNPENWNKDDFYDL